MGKGNKRNYFLPNFSSSLPPVLNVVVCACLFLASCNRHVCP